MCVSMHSCSCHGRFRQLKSHADHTNLGAASVEAQCQPRRTAVHARARQRSFVLEQRDLQQQNTYSLLQQLVDPPQLQKLIVSHPEVLYSALHTWVDFLTGYGLQHSDISRLLLACPELFTSSNVYDAGRTLLFFKQLGWKDTDILSRIVPYYPNLLAKQLERDVAPVVTYLLQMGCSMADVKLLVWEFPRIFCRDYRRHIRKFQYLGLYGLPAPGSSSSSSGGSEAGRDTDSLRRLLRAFQ
eukprot:GHRR01014298.1.p1 GENE.GHRR01014298.1~~GHRR01014298.1.p1  ORF type:complete len:242 (+),score=41.25 GHRR01014298.1:206-931(+)